MSTSLAPDAAPAAEPSMAEAFGELANAIAAEDDNAPEQETTSPAPSDLPAPAAPAIQAPASASAPDAKAPAAETQQAAPNAPAAPAPDAPAAPDAPVDPFKDRQPLTYVVDGQNRTFDGAIVIPGQGAIIPHDVLPRLQDRLQQADRLGEQNKQLYQIAQEYQQFGGRDGITTMLTQRALLDKTGALLVEIIGKPDVLMELATDPVARQHLLKNLELTARETQFAAANHFREQFSRPSPAAVAERAQETSRLAIHNAVEQIANMFPGMTSEDATAVRDHAWRVASAIVRPATADEARIAGVQPGASIIDTALLHQWLTDRHTMRQQLTAAQVKKEQDAKDNAARLAATAPAPTNGRPAAPRPGAGKAPPAPKQKKLDEMSSSEITRAMRTGKIFELIGAPDE